MGRRRARALSALGAFGGLLAFFGVFAGSAAASPRLVATEIRLPSDALTTTSANPPVLDGVACTSAGNCVAVGSYFDNKGSFDTQPMVARETNGTWARAVTIALPSGHATVAGKQRSSLTGVTCTGAGHCVAVGYYQDSSNDGQVFGVTETNGRWGAAAKLQEPTGASTTDFEPTIGEVSCSSASNCYTVGSYYDQAGDNQQAMVVHYNGTSWTKAVEITPPSDAHTTHTDTLNGVSCTSDRCVAVGSYRDTGGNTQAMYASESSGTWAHAVKVASPSMSATDPSAVLDAVACPSDGNCVAVGNYSDDSTPNSYEQAMRATEATGAWGQAVEVAPPSPSRAGLFGPNAQLLGVGCTSAGNCAAGGTYYDANGGEQGMLESLTAGGWGTALESPLPNNATTTAGAQDASLRGVACLTASECTYVGFYTDSNGDADPFALAPAATGNKTDPVFAGWTFHPTTAARSVTASYKAPRLKCTPTTAGVAPGVAMATGAPKNEKFSAATVLFYCSHGVSHALPDAEVDGKQAGAPSTDKVHPGDVLKATVTTSATTTTATIADTTPGHRFTWTKSGTGGTSFKEWVIDDSTAFGPIAHFGSITFSAAAVGGKALGSVSPAGMPYNMKTSKGIVQVVTGALTGTTKNVFTTTWKHS